MNNRAPSVNETHSNGLHHGLALYEKGNTQLRPERAYRGLIQLQFSRKTTDLTAQVFIQRVNGFIHAEPQAVPILTIRGAFPVSAFQQNDAQFYGGHCQVARTLTSHLSLTASALVLRARLLANHRTPAYTPPDQYRILVRYSFLKISNHRITAEWKLNFHQKQWRFNTDQDQLATPKAALTNDLIVHCKTTFRQHQIDWNVGIDNIFNTSYRLYTDRMRYYHNALGRNLHLDISIPINTFQK
jgi:iron complex outermembrane receptor protein